MEGLILNFESMWSVGTQIGHGGFGRVYELNGGTRPAVAKFVPKAPGADREMLFVGLKSIRNVVPVIDSGELDSHWVLVMPRAERSLRDHLAAQGVLDHDEALIALLDVVAALADLDGRVVHRDIKPENVLFLDGTWCLADFGISRYAEATTAQETHKWSLSPPYAAPERWRSERATSATDIYALGVIGFEMLDGHRPFPGPATEDFREQHLHANPSALVGAPTPLATVLDECLFKAASARPSPANLLARLTRQQEAPATGGLAALQRANQAEVRRRVEAERQASAAQSASSIRADRVAAAKSLYERLVNSLRDAIHDAAPAVTIKQDQNRGTARKLGWSAQLGTATLSTTDCVTSVRDWGSWPPAFGIDAYAGIVLRIPTTFRGYEGRAHSLWFGDVQTQGEYAWYETAFMLSALTTQSSSVAPFSLEPGERAGRAIGLGMAEYQVAWPFTRLEPENLTELIERWATWFAQAAEGQLGQPSVMPERPSHGSWRSA